MRNQPYEPPARFDLDQNTCFSEGGIVRLRGAGPPSVRRKIKFVVALVMVTGGGLWLLFQLFIADYVFGRLIIAACLIVEIGHIGYGPTTSMLRPIRRMIDIQKRRW